MLLPRFIRSRRRAFPFVVVTTVLIAGLMAIPSAGFASAVPSAPAPPAAAAGQVGAWSFGNVSTMAISGSETMMMNAGFAGNMSYGFVTNVTAVNTSSTTTEVSVEQTFGVGLSLEYCRPSCTSSSRQVSSFAYTAHEVSDSWTNLTTLANVSEAINGTPTSVPALGVLNSSTRVVAHVNESLSDNHRMAGSPTFVRSMSGTYDFSSDSSVAFATPLGILPLGPISSGQSWGSTAAYLATARWAASWTIALATTNGSTTVTGSTGAGPSTFPGVAYLYAAARPGPFGVPTTQLLSLGYSLGGSLVVGPGPTVMWAVQGDLGMGMHGSNSWTQNMAAGGIVQVDALDSLPARGGVDRLRSSEVSFSLSVLDPDNQANQTVPTATASGSPYTPSQAAVTASCLQQPGVCATTSGIGATGGSSATTLVAGIAAVIVLAAVAGAVVVVRQRRIPPPKYPNAGLYPPGQPVGPTEPSAPSPGPREQPDDPLDQLW